MPLTNELDLMAFHIFALCYLHENLVISEFFCVVYFRKTSNCEPGRIKEETKHQITISANEKV